MKFKKLLLFIFSGVLVAGIVLQPALSVQADSLSPTDSPPSSQDILQLAPQFTPREKVILNIPKELEITRPSTESFSTSYSQFFLTGTSNPDEELFFRALGEENKQVEILRQGTQGTFGVLLDLEEKENSFEFIQSTNKKTVTIIRTVSVEEYSQTIDYITNNSMVPSGKVVYRVGDILILSCIAPSGGKVTATVGKDTVTLTQQAAADDGIPATFSTSYTLPNHENSDEVVDAGAVRYHLVYDNKSSSFESLGNLYIAGESVEIKGRVNTYTGFVYDDPNNITEFYELLKQDSVDYITDQSGGYYILSSGRYIPRGMMDIILDNENIDNIVSKVQHGTKARGEYFVFEGTTKPAYHGELVENEFVFTLYNTSLKGRVTLPPSVLFENATVEEMDDNLVITLPLKPDKDFFWGYNVTFGENGALFLEFQHKPHLSKGIHPLKNLTIMIDPGHGGVDVGALGTAGENGPMESDVNLAHGYAVADRLTSLGATVHLTRYGDEAVELDHRLRQFADSGADLFISLHHNSIDMNLEANDVKGTESYYYLSSAQNLADKIVGGVVEETGRQNRDSFQSYYRVTILPYAPSALVELGFMSSPGEYEKACDPLEIEKVAQGVVQGILKALE